MCHKVSWVKDMKAYYTENGINKNLSMQNGENCGTDTYLQDRVFLFPLKGLTKNLFQQVLLYFYDEKEHSGALIGLVSTSKPIQAAGT